MDRADIWVKIIKTGKLDYYRIRDIGDNGGVSKYHPQVFQAILDCNTLSSEQLTILAYSAKDANNTLKAINSGKITQREDWEYLVEEYGYHKPNAAILSAVLKVANFSGQDFLTFAKEYKNPLLWEVLMKIGKVSLEDIKRACGAKLVEEKMEAFGLKQKIELDAELLSAKYTTKEDLIEALKRQALQSQNRNMFSGLI